MLNRISKILAGTALFSISLLSIGQAEVSYRRGMTLLTPADQWREALPSGNGTVGALVYGSVNAERVLFNHNELWYGGKIDEVPDMSAELPVVRQLMLDGEYLEANDYYRKKLGEKGFSARNAMYHPAFDVLLTTDTQQIFKDYSRTVDFETGEVVVNWRDGATEYARSLFVSIPDGISVMQIRANQAGSVSGDVTLDIHDLKDAIQQNGDYFDPGFKYKTVAEDGFVEFMADGSDGGEFGGVLRAVAFKDGKAKAVLNVTEETHLHFNNVDEVVLLIAIYANEASETAVPRLKDQLANLKPNYAALFERHAEMHRAKFNSIGIDINTTEDRSTSNEHLLLDAYSGNAASTELLEKLFDYGRYLLISSSTAGGYPPGLQGIWNGDYRAPWSGLYGINENLQMNYWQALPGNLQESMMAFYDYFDAHLDEFRYNAKQLWGTEGIYIPPFMSPESGVMRMTAPHVVHWTDAAGWLASFYYDYYLFTGDAKFLEERAIPFMKEVALFYEDYAVLGEDGTYVFFPSQSPENQPADMMIEDPKTGRVTKIKVQMNSTIAVAICKEVLTNLIRSCEILNVEAEGVARWKKMLALMPEYQINEDGALREWMHPDFTDNYEHRHQSHIYPVFPGNEVTEESDPEIYEAARVAIEKRLVIGLQSQTGWSLAHMANVYARLGDGDKALEALDILTRSCLGKNFFTYHNDWRSMGVTLPFKWGQSAPFQMDANFGITAAITEMLCGSTVDMLRILPALPTKWEAGQFKDMQTRVGVTTSAQWDLSKKEIRLQLTAGRATGFTLKLPSAIQSIESDQVDRVQSSELGDQYRVLNLDENQSVRMTIHLR
ncbi:glycoside hydrolase N-terminal domain-containing protein [Coraliomargarita sp. SDUM461004]|uniref:Glycoside hydrolase N-terminal domain-containing protein n=1 Tax=Thalassobacterium sedimentorum TaxID=3041258 RepID=A0ABU1ALI1_9BACT|nr:glycoside hydrolase N-terminal domain-containing protein [Coraliomargarita sp. SDUM461004]MDQ8195643.1 glycoside hydrolase N-terminal domain-containing protein [Coraliomargarita sp. SDUM461004]